jgi:hypothetical protein
MGILALCRCSIALRGASDLMECAIVKTLPTNPMAFQARAIDTLLADIRDPSTKRFDRLNALHALRFKGETK